MKTTRSLLATLTLALIAGFLTLGSPAAAEAGGYQYSSHCAPYKVRTVELCRQRCSTVRYDHCGRACTVWYTVVTYRDLWSNGAIRDYRVTHWS